MRAPRSTTGAFSASASSTMRFTPSCERAARSATITRRSAPASSFAASLSAPDSPCGGTESASFGIASFFSSSMACSCSVPSAMITTGSRGGVMASR